MISYDRIIAEMGRQLSVARQTNDEGAMREALSAIRSLCEVALSDGTGLERASRPPEKVIPKMLSTSEVQSPTSFDGKLLEESDANGGSLFEF